MITCTDAARFDRDGYWIVDSVTGQDEITTLLSAMERVYRGEYNHDRRPPAVRKLQRPFGSSSSVQWILNARFLDRDLWAHATSTRLGETAARLLKTNSVSIVEDQLFDKPPSVGRPVNMHQDYGYWRFSDRPQMITRWIALVDIELDHGPIHVLPRSHHWGAGPNPKELIIGVKEGWLTAARSVKPENASLNTVPVLVRAGGGVFLHSLTFHGSSRNTSSVCRRACSLHWAAEECRVVLSETAKHDFPFMFARLRNDGPLVNHYYATNRRVSPVADCV